ncbi:hypothetical protein OH77DRAFT_1048402 [Trametes cingulata]|nr:hypothetical protein OH77DRAFT_1048402 [Trametes cingulata]
MQGSFEPISPPGLDFGDLPASTGAPAAVVADKDVEELDIAAAPTADHVGASNLPQETISGQEESVDVPASAALAEDQSAKESSEPRRFSVGLEEVTDEDEPAPRRPHEAAETEVVVIEVDDDEDEDIRSSAPPADDIDIASVRGDFEAAGLEYIVEEAMTEGRRTAEPDMDADEDGTIYLSERAKSVDRASKEPDSGRIEANPEVEEPADDEEAEEASSEPKVTSTTSEHLPPTTTGPAALERTHSSTDFPPPVSANPNVPDPASIPHTPLSPASPEATSPSPSVEAHDAATLPANAASHPLFRKLASASHSPSGLFTPLPNEMSASVTPEREDSGAPAGKPEDQEAVESTAVAEQTESGADQTEVAEAAMEDGERPAEVIEPPEEEPIAVDDTVTKEQDSTSDSPVEEVTAEDRQAEATEERSMEVAKSAEDIVARDFAAGQRESTPGTDVDADAEGEVDPEYVLSEGAEPEDSSTEVLQTVLPGEGDESPKGGDAEETPEQPAEPEAAQVEPLPPSPLVDIPEDKPVEAAPASETAVEGDEAPASSPVDEHDETKDEGRPLKRKRGSPAVPTTSSRVTRSKTSYAVRHAFMDHVERKMAKAKKAKARGKQRAEAETDEDDNASVAHSQASASTSGGSSTAAQKMLVPSSSRGTSRASSVASNAPSAYSGLSMPSPTVDRVLPSNGQHGPPPPFIHNHGILHHHHGRPMAPVVPVVPKRQPSEPPATLSEVARRASAEPGPSSQPLPPRAPAAAPSTSSPITRSNCRFHTISVPREKGPRVLFAVPGCALGGNAELMKDEEIEDQGLVKAEDIPRLIRDVESLNLSPYLVGLLRQLVGVDLLREQEVFYIPRPGDGVILKSKKKSHRAKLKQRESISARTLSNGGASRTKESSLMAPPSQASVSTSGESASAAGRLSLRGSVGTSASLSGSELSELEDDAPPAKRAKESPPEETRAEPAEQPSGVPGPSSEVASAPAADEEGASTSTAGPQARKLQPRRSRRLGTDASAYKPEGGESDGSDGEAENETKKGRKRGGRRGVKRTRTEDGEAPAEGASDKPKRRRVRASASNGHKPAPETEGAAS